MANLCLPTSRLFISRPLVLRTGRVRSKQPTTQIYSAGQHRRMSNADCLFCKIVAGKIPSEKLYESDKTFAFLDIGPLSKGHALVIPKHHGTKLLDIPDDSLTEILSVLKKIAKASGAEDYNVLQNNGRAAHQLVDHVHFHFIPKPNKGEGLGIEWPTTQPDKAELKEVAEQLRAMM